MIQYGLNIIICSGLLFLLYKVLLENEKMHVFKRFYLLFSVLLSLIAPLITISFSSAPDHNIALQYLSKEPVDFIINEPLAPVKHENNVMVLLPIIIYLLGLALALFRFFKKLSCFIIKTTKSEQLLFNRARLVLVDKEIIPHSFLSSIFLNREAYKRGLIENEILVHEITHVKQLHSLDVLFVQLVQCLFWVNPFFILYTKAIQLNHEFLSDEVAAKTSTSPLLYQQLLLAKASGKQQISLASQFNYSIIKKRLVMIAKQSSRQSIVVKQMVAISVCFLAMLLFISKETVAQNIPQTGKKETLSTNGLLQQLLDEYQATLDKHKFIDDKGNVRYSPFTKEEKIRMEAIYKSMTKEQQDNQPLRFVAIGPFKKAHPTQAQLDSWADGKTYGVWLDGKRIKNSELSNYKPFDLDHFYISKLNKTAINYGKHYYQVDLMTIEYYAQYVKKSKEAGPSILPMPAQVKFKR